MKRWRNEQRVLWMLWTLVALGICAGVTTVGMGGWSISSLRADQAESVEQERELVQASLEVRRLVDQAREDIAGLLQEEGSGPQDPSTIHKLRELIRERLDSTDDQAVWFVLIQLQSYTSDLEGIWDFASSWRRRYEVGVHEPNQRPQESGAKILGLRQEQKAWQRELEELLKRIRPLPIEFVNLAQEHATILSKEREESLARILVNILVFAGGCAAVYLGLAWLISQSIRRQVAALEASKDTLENQAKELVETRDEALEALKIKTQFLATMSHEIRTPMNGVMGMTGLLLETDLTKDQRECAETVKQSADALLTIINDILDFSKIEAGKLELEVIDFDLRAAVEDVLDLLEPKAEEKGLELVGLVYASVPTAVHGDPGRLRQILLNLVSNAIKFTKHGEVVVHVVPEQEAVEEALLRIEVTDTGIGMTPEERARLFQSFSQVDASTTRRYGGTGLGLAIAKQLVELMGGTIGVDSEPGRGTRFWFTVRLQKQAVSQSHESAPGADLAGWRVCVVADNEANRLLLHNYTNDWGMSCSSTESGPAALELLREMASRGKPCNVILADMQLAGMDGFELARQVKADPTLSGIRMVLLTSQSRRGDAAAARGAGISGYLTKPIHQSQLRECMIRVLDRSRTAESPLITKHTIREEQRRPGARLLVAEDNVVNQKVAVRMVEKLGYRADVVGNGLEAVEVLERIPYDLVLMDCQMPEMDGFEATREIRKREALGVRRHVPIIAMTANTMKGDREKCLAAGMDDFVPKPVKLEDLTQVLERWVRRKEHSAELGVNREAAEGPSSDASRLTPHDSPPLDQAVLDELRSLGGEDDPLFLSTLINQFLQDIPTHVEAIRQAVEQANADALMKAAHAFKGASRNMGAPGLAALCLELEEMGRAATTEGAENLLSPLQSEVDRVRPALQAEGVRPSDVPV